MKRKTTFKLNSARKLALLALPLLAVAASPAFAVTYNLVAGATTVTPAGSATAIPMWGFGCADQLCVDAVVAAGGTATVGGITVPGPKLSVPVGDTSLVINLTNSLPAMGVNGAEPVSIIIDGLPMPTGGVPVYFTDANGKQRVRSLTTETAPGASGTYTWTVNKSGTFLYRSGTHMQVQDQMGLYGAVTHDAALGQAYGPTTAYDKDVTLLYSEIDPVIHTAVSAGTFGPSLSAGVDQCNLPVSAPRTLPVGWVCSTVKYNPKFFLVNGTAYNGTGTNEFVAGNSGKKTLVRFLNAGLQTHVPVLNGVNLSLVAEDGNLYPYAKNQYSAFLPAMKTMDALFTPTLAAGATALKLPVVDRMLKLTNNGVGNGGMLAYLTVGTAALNPPQFDLTGCLPGPLNVGAGSSVTCNLSAHSTVSPPPTTAPTFTYSIVTGPTYVSLAGNAITAAPGATDVSSPVTVQVTESNGASTTATFNVDVASNTAPTITSVPVTTANADVAYSYTVTAADTDVPAQTLTFSLVTAPVGMVIDTNTGIISWTPTAAQSGPQSVTVRVTDSGTPVLTADQSFTVNVTPPANTAPSITSTAVTTATVGTPYSYTVTASDNDVPVQTLTFSAVTVPAGMTITSGGVISWTPGAAQAGSHNVTVRVTDSGSPALTADQSFPVDVAPLGNLEPTITSAPITTATVGVAYSYTVTATDADLPAQTLAFSAVTVPAGMTINATTGVINWTPVAGQVGQQNVTVRVTDNGVPVLFTDHAFTITVVANQAPVVVNDVYTVARNSGLVNVMPILSNDTDTTGGINPASVLINSMPTGWTRTVSGVTARYTKATQFTAATCTNIYPGASVVTVASKAGCNMPANQYVLPRLGFVTVAATGVLTYKPALNFTGTESFGYSVADILSLRSSGTVRANVR